MYKTQKLSLSQTLWRPLYVYLLLFAPPNRRVSSRTQYLLTVITFHCLTLLFFLANLCYRECEVFSKNHAAPFSKVITFHKREPFDLEAFYSNPQELPYSDHRIGNGANSALLASK